MNSKERREDRARGPLLTQPGPEAAHRVAPSRPRAPLAVFLIKPKHVDSDHVLGARAQSCGPVPQEPLGVLVPGQAIGGHGRGGPGGGCVAATRDPKQQQKPGQQRQQLGPWPRAGVSGAPGHGGWRWRRAGVGKEGGRGRTGDCRLTLEGGRAAALAAGGRGVRAARGDQSSAQSVRRPSSRPAVTAVRPEPSPAGALPPRTRASELRGARSCGLGGFEGRSGAGGQRRLRGTSCASRTTGAAANRRVPGPGCACARLWRGARRLCARVRAECGGVGVGVGERAPRSPGWNPRTATLEAPVFRRQGLAGLSEGVGAPGRGSRRDRLPGCPCNGMRGLLVSGSKMTAPP